MRKLKIYLDTSVINFFDASDSPDYMNITREFFDKHLNEYDVFISEIVLLEITRTTDPERKKALLAVIERYGILVYEKLTPEIELLAGRYITEGLIPENKLNDALHIAFSTFYDFDILLSWNFRHLANIKKQIAVNNVNKAEGYLKTLLLLNPMEVLSDG